MTRSNAPFDALETRSPADREHAQFAALQAQLQRVQTDTLYGQQALRGVAAASVTDRAALAALPVLRKADIAARQAAHAYPVLGGLVPEQPRPAKVFQSPGPIYEPEGSGADPWRTARALWAAGFRAGDLVHNSFSYHLTPAGSMLESGARHLGCSVLPAGVGNTELQLQAVADLQPVAYCGTPSFLRILLEKGARSFRKALVSGEAFPPALRDWCLGHGVVARQAYATADCGLIAYETEAQEGLVVDEGVIVEVVEPGSGRPVGEGEVGEVVVTRLDSAYPLIRYATGDLSAFLPGTSPCGRTGPRLRGWMGRADQSAKVRGMFIHESQFMQFKGRLAQAGFAGRARWVVSGAMAQDHLSVWLDALADDALAETARQLMREITKLRAEVVFVQSEDWPTDGRAIEDERPR